MASTSSLSSEIARKTFELHNEIKFTPSDEVFRYSREEQKAFEAKRYWKSDPNYFKKVRISAVALIKMVIHARSGLTHEVMGMMQGKVEDETMVVMDAFALPVEGTETRVNASEAANEYMVQFTEASKQVGRMENVVGWYHSHPGYGCWLSGIDVQTQMTNQMFTDPFIAIVGYVPPTATSSQYQSIPLSKIEDFGAHANSYYSLEIEHFKSSLDEKVLEALWNKYWIATITQSGLISNRAYQTSQISDLVEKFARAEQSTFQRSPLSVLAPQVNAVRQEKNKGKGKGTAGGGDDDGDGKVNGNAGAETGSGKDVRKEDSALGKVVKDGLKIHAECHSGSFGQIIKDMLFNFNPDPDHREHQDQNHPPGPGGSTSAAMETDTDRTGRPAGDGNGTGSGGSIEGGLGTTGRRARPLTGAAESVDVVMT